MCMYESESEKMLYELLMNLPETVLLFLFFCLCVYVLASLDPLPDGVRIDSGPISTDGQVRQQLIFLFSFLSSSLSYMYVCWVE